MSDADTLQFVDTNVLIYAHDTSAGMRHTRAKALVQGLWESGAGCLSTQVLQEFYVNVTRKVATLSPEVAAQRISDVSAWRIHQPGVNDILDAIALHAEERISFWDAMILTSARSLGCAVLWTEDLNDGQRYGPVLVRNPFLTP
jgi:predicted nucleic acid-binding protein